MHAVFYGVNVPQLISLFSTWWNVFLLVFLLLQRMVQSVHLFLSFLMCLRNYPAYLPRNGIPMVIMKNLILSNKHKYLWLMCISLSWNVFQDNAYNYQDWLLLESLIFPSIMSEMQFSYFNLHHLHHCGHREYFHVL